MMKLNKVVKKQVSEELDTQLDSFIKTKDVPNPVYSDAINNMEKRREMVKKIMKERTPATKDKTSKVDADITAHKKNLKEAIDLDRMNDPEDKAGRLAEAATNILAIYIPLGEDENTDPFDMTIEALDDRFNSFLKLSEQELVDKYLEESKEYIGEESIELTEEEISDFGKLIHTWLHQWETMEDFAESHNEDLHDYMRFDAPYSYDSDKEEKLEEKHNSKLMESSDWEKLMRVFKNEFGVDFNDNIEEELLTEAKNSTPAIMDLWDQVYCSLTDGGDNRTYDALGDLNGKGKYDIYEVSVAAVGEDGFNVIVVSNPDHTEALKVAEVYELKYEEEGDDFYIYIPEDAPVRADLLTMKKTKAVETEEEFIESLNKKEKTIGELAEEELARRKGKKITEAKNNPLEEDLDIKVTGQDGETLIDETVAIDITTALRDKGIAEPDAWGEEDVIDVSDVYELEDDSEEQPIDVLEFDDEFDTELLDTNEEETEELEDDDTFDEEDLLIQQYSKK